MFKHVRNKMMSNGHRCIDIIDEEKLFDYKNIDDDIVLITSDHIDLKIDGSYSNLDICEKFGPKKCVYSPHDLGGLLSRDEKIHLKNWTVLSPGEIWTNVYKECAHKDIVECGFLRYNSNEINIKHDRIFFVSNVYLYYNKPDAFYNNFKRMFDLKIPMKFPQFSKSQILIDGIKKFDPVILETDILSFDMLSETRMAISNGNSSIAIEASIIGCDPINFGKGYKPVFDKFEVLNMGSCNFEMLIRDREPMIEYMADIDKAIDVIIS
jgi:hypothetical protein